MPFATTLTQLWTVVGGVCDRRTDSVESGVHASDRSFAVVLAQPQHTTGLEGSEQAPIAA